MDLTSDGSNFRGTYLFVYQNPLWALSAILGFYLPSLVRKEWNFVQQVGPREKGWRGIETGQANTRKIVISDSMSVKIPNCIQSEAAIAWQFIAGPQLLIEKAEGCSCCILCAERLFFGLYGNVIRMVFLIHLYIDRIGITNSVY